MKHAALRNDRPEDDNNNADHRPSDPSQDEAVHEQPEINCLESTKKCSRFSTIADFAELDVSQNFCSPPVTRKKEHRQHAAHAEAPPDPVPGYTLPCDHSADKQRRIRSKRGRHHRSARQPPRDVAVGNEKLFRIPACAARVMNTDCQVNQQISDDDDPISQGERHASSGFVVPACAYCLSTKISRLIAPRCYLRNSLFNYGPSS